MDYLVQGTIYPDVVESGVGGESAVIKSHHNVGGLPDYVDFKEIIEPLRDLFKDEVRQAGRELGIPECLVSAVSPSRAPAWQSHHRRGDRREDQDGAGCRRHLPGGDRRRRRAHKHLGQYFAALTNMRSVGVMGDERTYDYAVALRAVSHHRLHDGRAAPTCRGICWPR